MTSEVERVFTMLDPVRDGLAAGYEFDVLMSGTTYQEMSSRIRQPGVFSSFKSIHEQLLNYYRVSARLPFTTLAWRRWTRLLMQLFILQGGADLLNMAAKVRRDAIVERTQPALARVLVRSAFRDIYFRCARQTYGPNGRGRARDAKAYEQTHIL